ncbi:gluconokinase [Kordiimonas sp.]|uniref:gluconokinase n=1 Tax=Kordiimonas sp. TaxID=1970157 RepID=UPI003A8F5D16
MMCPEAAIVIMGVSGCGKSTVGRCLADRLGYSFFDADDFHPASNVEKMRAGVPLNDEDRQPWLERLVRLMDEQMSMGEGVVLACSALKGRYRRVLSSGQVVPRFVFLDGTREVIAARMGGRDGHFMPLSLLDSQFDALEVPSVAIKVDVDRPVDVLISEIERRLEMPAL